MDHLLQTGFVGNSIEQRIVSRVQQSRVESIRRGRQADDSNMRIHHLQVAQKLLVHRVRLTRNQVRLIDEHQIHLHELRRLAVHRLYPTEDNRRLVVALLQSG